MSVSLAIYYTLVSYPGIFFTDTLDRWLNIPRIILNREPTPLWLNPIPSFFMILLFEITGSYASLTFLQSFALCFTTCLLIENLQIKLKWLALVICLNPLVIGYSALGDMGVVCLIAINLIALSLFKIGEAEKFSRLKNIGVFLQFALYTVLLVGFRANALTLIPLFAVLGYIVCKKIKSVATYVFLMLGMVVGIGVVFLAPAAVGVQTYNASSAGFTWEILGTINRMPEHKKEEYIHFLDDVRGTGSTKEALEQYNTNNVNSWLWSAMPVQAIGIEKGSGQIYDKYMHLCFNETGYFLQNKVELIGHTMGVQKPLDNLAITYKANQDMNQVGFVDSPRRHEFINNVNGFINGVAIVRMPWIWFLFGLASVLYQKIRYKNNKFIYLFFMACFYYGAFFINNQSFELRYFFPSLLLLLIIFAATVCDLMQPLLEKARYAIAKK